MTCWSLALPPKVPRRVAPRPQQRGAAVVEFALLLPVLLVLLLGTLEGSLALYDKAVITNASREGARAGIVARNPRLSDAEIRQVVQAYTQSALIDFSPSSPPPVVSISQGSLGTDPTLRVSVSYTFQGLGLGALFAQLGQPWVMNASTVMVYE
jgi:Flp pilus assembly protein TadG